MAAVYRRLPHRHHQHPPSGQHVPWRAGKEEIPPRPLPTQGRPIAALASAVAAAMAAQLTAHLHAPVGDLQPTLTPTPTPTLTSTPLPLTRPSWRGGAPPTGAPRPRGRGGALPPPRPWRHPPSMPAGTAAAAGRPCQTPGWPERGRERPAAAARRGRPEPPAWYVGEEGDEEAEMGRGMGSTRLGEQRLVAEAVPATLGRWGWEQQSARMKAAELMHQARGGGSLHGRRQQMVAQMEWDSSTTSL